MASRQRSRRSIANIPTSKKNVGADKENMTADISSLQPNVRAAKPSLRDKKSRSKSLGPGGLDALQNSTGNRRKSMAALPLKSILKPTVPVSPLRPIPSFEETRKRSSVRNTDRGAPKDDKKGPNVTTGEGVLIDFSTPTRTPVTGSNQLANPFEAFNASSAIRDAKQREEKERRERERQAILEQREVRRKSMANRRVSFAPEATLHTWNVVELVEDSTTSSTSNSTRRASSLTEAAKQAQAHESNPSEDLSSPQHATNADASLSPTHHHNLRQGEEPFGPSLLPDAHDSIEPAGDLSSSPYSGSSIEGSEETGLQSPTRPGDGENPYQPEADDDFDGKSTTMSIDDATGRTTGTAHSDGLSTSSSSSARLNEALRQAAQEAGTRRIDFDENSECSMEIVDQEITGAFQPWIMKGQRKRFDMEDLSALQEQETINQMELDAASHLHQANNSNDDSDNEELSMEITNAVGHILSKQSDLRQSAGRRKSSGEETNYEEKTMEFTKVLGGITGQDSPVRSVDAESNISENEEMTMEFTSVFGGVLGKNPTTSSTTDDNDNACNQSLQQAESKGRNFSEWTTDEDDIEETGMEFTGAVGGILPPIEERTEPQDDSSGEANITTAIGIIPAFGLTTDNKQRYESPTQLEFDAGKPASSPFQEQVPPSPLKLSPSSYHVAPVALENGSPSLASVRSRRTRGSTERRASITFNSCPRPASPVRNPSTPSKQPRPQRLHPSTPAKTPSSEDNAFRSASPKKLFRHESRASANGSKSPSYSLFENTKTGEAIPAFILQPQGRRSSGLGIDKEGLGSPCVAAMLDRRRSIWEDAPAFVLHEQPSRGVRFEDPLKIQEEVDREREEEENREDGHILPVHQSERDATLNLKELISSLTPKKKVGGRKSLHVGAAKGLLGKRPVELDQDDDEEDNNSPKRFRVRDASPVKNVKLPAPPTKDETVGRMTRSVAKNGDSTPRKQGLFINAKSPSKNTTASLQPRPAPPPDKDMRNVESVELQLEPIQLQDFLNMTNIHFMELTTTKRRHTMVPSGENRGSSTPGKNDSRKEAISLEDCVAAGFCTVPILELYQHSCRELKSYISEGRRIIRSIEAETYIDNPPLFREYVTAPPDIRLFMDNQFRNVKMHARLLSKAMWYEWRMKLLEGLKEGLDRHVDEMKADDEALTEQEESLHSVVPGLVEKHIALETEAHDLQQMIDEMKNCDQNELLQAREKLSSIEAVIAAKKKLLESMQEDLQGKVETIEAGSELKAEFLEQIHEAERVKEECRGWSVSEVNALKASVQMLENQSGWSIISAVSSPRTSAGPSLTMSYNNELRVSFHPMSLGTQPGQSNDASMNTSIEITYSPKAAQRSASSRLTLTKSLILCYLQKNLQTLQQSSLTPRQLLSFLSEAWKLAIRLEEEIRVLEFYGVIKPKLAEHATGASLRTRCTLLGNVRGRETNHIARLPNIQNGRVDIDIVVTPYACVRTGTDKHVGDHLGLGKLALDTDVMVHKVYGFGDGGVVGVSESEMRTSLLEGLQANSSELGSGVWGTAARDLASIVF